MSRNDVWDRQQLEPEDAHLEQYRHKLGFSRMIEERRARAWLKVACPDLQPAALEQQVRFAYEMAHRNDETFQETSARLSRQWAAEGQAKFDAGESERPIGFNKIELEYLAEHFEGANHPVAIAIQAKARQNL